MNFPCQARPRVGLVLPNAWAGRLIPAGINKSNRPRSTFTGRPKQLAAHVAKELRARYAGSAKAVSGNRGGFFAECMHVDGTCIKNLRFCS